VLTVVAKLFGLVRPTTAVFGAKDYQQLVLVRRMARELFLGIEVLDVETVREPDGLALSSRNAYLSPPERRLAPVLANALAAGAQREVDGAAAVAQAARAVLAVVPDLEVDYLVVADPDLGPPPEVGVGRLLVAARLGRTRLLDNTAVHLGGR
jgi:pantoate--beta-alanine ligase